MRTVVITGGAGYIGSHTCLALIAAGYAPVIFDSLAGASRSVLRRLHYMLGKPVPAEIVDLMDVQALRTAIERHRPVAVIHLASPPGLRLPRRPDNARARAKALDDHVWLGFNLINAMESAGCRTLVAASSQSVYTHDGPSPLREDAPKAWTELPGHAHLALEDLYESITKVSSTWRIGCLRLFNVAGAHSSQCLGPALARPSPNWLMELAYASSGMLPHATVRGWGLPTPDGTALRDFVHVEDVARAFALALDALDLYGESFSVNIGSGAGSTVMQVLDQFKAVCGKPILTKFKALEPLEPIASVADVGLARELLGWQPRYSLANMCAHTMGWHDAYLQRRLPA